MTEPSDALAIVGMAFRFPGDLNDEESFWTVLRQGQDAVGEIPRDRWDIDVYRHPTRREPGRSITFSAGVLSRIDEWDAGFFGVSPREAAWLDPQQRLLLELTWEAFENGGFKASALAGTDCSVYVGISGLDYGVRVIDDLAGMGPHSMTGHTFSIAANRLSYVFDLHGPSVAMDTACSSSLVALHHACNALRHGESSMAVVGGVNLLLHPYPFIGFTKASMLSANGRCRAFDAAGDGYVRAEGGAVLLVKPLARAEADGDDIQAVILASGVNADGARKTGITIPSTEGQAELMRQVAGRSGIGRDEVDYVEAHGTGTAVGDPIEAASIGEVYGRARPAGRPLPIGSVKTNLGHLEAASGMAGLVKSVLVLKNRAVPPTINLETPNPRIDFAGLNLEPVTGLRPLAPPPGRERLVVGLNSFGFGGANAHLLLQEYRRPAAGPARPAAAIPPLVLSARTPAALRELAGRYAERLQSHPEDYPAVAAAAALGRDRLEKRLAFQSRSGLEAAAALAVFAEGGGAAGLVTEDAPAETGEVAFVYSGNGSQWLGMGCRLLSESPRFAALMADLDRRLAPLAGFSPIAELQADRERSRIEDTAVAQPLLFALQVAATILLGERGVAARAVTGHSVGEVAAAWAAGALDLDQACRVICARSAAQAATRGQGRMAAVGLSGEAAAAAIAEAGLRGIEVAAFNSPKGSTVSGDPEELMELKAGLDARGVFCRVLDLDYPFHSRKMDPIAAGLVGSLRGLAPHPTEAGPTAFVSTVTGVRLDGAALGADYWWRNVREPVRFADAVAALAELGCRVFVEIGPNAILQRYIGETLAAKGVSGRALPSLRRNDDGMARLDEAALRSLLLTGPERLAALCPDQAARIRLPNYPWQRERHWHGRTPEGYGLIDRGRVHPLLGWRLKEHETAWENVLDPLICPWLSDHMVMGAVVLPAAAYAEMAVAAAREIFGGDRFLIEQLEIQNPVVFDGDNARSLRLEVSAQDGGFRILSRQRLGGDAWTQNAAGRLLRVPAGTAAPPAASTVAGNGAAIVARDEHYRRARAIGLDYGPAFQGLERCAVEGPVLHGDLTLPGCAVAEAPDYILHPAVLDVCFQALIEFLATTADGARPYLPVKIGELRCFGGPAPVAGFRAVLRRHGPRSALADFELYDARGGIVALAGGCRFRAAPLHRPGPALPACWTVRPHLQPLDAGLWRNCLPGTRALARPVELLLAERDAAARYETYLGEIVPLFDALVLSFAHEAFAELSERRADWLRGALAAPDRLSPAVRPLFSWLVRILSLEGLLLVRDDGSWSLEAAALPPSATVWHTLLREAPAASPVLVLAARVGGHLAGLLTGALDPEAFAQGLRRSPQLEALFAQSPDYGGSEFGIEQMLRRIAGEWPADRRLRVLEIGAISRSAAGPLLARQLPGDVHDCVVAPLDDETAGRLRAEYGHDPAVTVVGFDPRRFQLAEKAGPARFDVVILRHCLHRADDPAAALAALRERMAPGAVLLLAEHHPDLASDFLFGSDPGWWRAGPDGEPSSRLFPTQAWERLLANQGFEEVGGLCRAAAADEAAGGDFLLLARSPDGTAAPTAEMQPARWALLVDGGERARRLAEATRDGLAAAGHRVLLIARGDTLPPALDDADQARAMLEAARRQLGGLDHLVHFAAVDGPGLSAEAEAGVGRLAHLIQGLARPASGTRLWLVAAGGALAGPLPGGPEPAPGQGALWGLGRVAMNEHPELCCTLLDLHRDLPVAEAARRLQLELNHPDGESEAILSPAGRHVPRMERVEPPAPPPPAPPLAVLPPSANPGEESRFHLDFHVPGQLHNLVWLPDPSRQLADDEVEARVVAVGLNFRDVMYLMGLLPDEAVENGFSGASLGLEFAGVITRVGKSVAGLTVGAPVMGFAAACFASHVVTKARAVIRKPAGWSFESAATVPTTFFTAYYALRHLVDLQPGERVLIHGGAGGVGIAAIQIALHLGAEVFASAGTDEKRDLVRLLGVDHVFDSRSLAFADQIPALTGGEGVDVVLNSLAGEAVRRSLGVLKPFGRFVELGKRDYFQNTPIGLRYFKDNVSYFGVDADQLLNQRPALAVRLFEELSGLFRDETLFPLPYRAFAADQVVEAFRTMQQSRHIGKVVVRIEGARVAVEAPPAQAAQAAQAAPRIRGTWMVTGGLSGFGLETAKWLAERGAARLVLVSRRGPAAPGAAEAAAAIEARGARVAIFACDVAVRAELERVLDEIRQDGPPLAGLVHAAMVLDDGLLLNLDGRRFADVLRPKLRGAWNLHELTREIRLDHFVLYSSVTTLIGNPGQANYVAANAGLEQLAALRRAQGRPALCVAWGPIGDAGYLARNEAVREGLAARLGAAPLAAASALAMLGRLLAGPSDVRSVSDLDWPSLARLLPSADAARFAALRGAAGAGAGQDGADLRLLLAGKPPEEALPLIVEAVRRDVAEVLCIAPESVDPATGLHQMGMDSLMAVELALGLERSFGIQLPPMLLSEGPSIARVAEFLAGRLLRGEDGPEDTAAGGGLQEMAAMLAAQHGESLSEAFLADTVDGIRGQSAAGRS